MKNESWNLSIKEKFVCIFLSFVLFLRLYHRNGFVNALGHRISLFFNQDSHIFIILISLLISALGFFAFVLLYRLLRCGWIRNQCPLQFDKDKIQIGFKDKIFILILAVLCISVFSKSSPLYPFNDWTDSNCFFTMGKAIANGLVPYRDIYEQKGPLLYFIHALAYCASNTTFIGIYFLEIIACAVFLFYSCKIIRIYINSRLALAVLPILAFTVYSASYFCHGDSVEELCLPMATYSLYVGLMVIRRKKSPDNFSCILLGMMAAGMLWMKFNQVGFYIGWIIVPAAVLIANKKSLQLFRMIGFIALGVIIVTLPILIYFWLNNSICDLFRCYFYNNIFIYHKKNVFLLIKLVKGFWKLIIPGRYFVFFILQLCMLVILEKRNRTDVIFICFTYLATGTFVYFNGHPYPYYSFIMNIFVAYGFLPVFILMIEILKKRKALGIIAFSVLTALSCILCVRNSSNIYLIFKDKAIMPQFQFAEIINSVEDSTMLNYGFLDGGFYTAADKIPVSRFFCLLTIELPEMKAELDSCVQNSETTFVITRNATISNPAYKLVKTSDFYYERNLYKYYLYQLKSSLEQSE